MKILDTWKPLCAEESDHKISVNLDGREYSLDHTVLFSSMKSLGEELLARPIRMIGRENGKELTFGDGGVFIHARDDEKVVICSYQQSESFLFNCTITVEYDGFSLIDLKLVPKGRTMQQIFGLVSEQQAPVCLEKLWLEIPIVSSLAELYHIFPEADIMFENENTVRREFSMSGRLDGNVRMPFKPIIWLGNEEKGFAFYAESDENWQPDEENSAIEIIQKKEETVLRLHLLDSVPETWRDIQQEKRQDICFPISYKFALQATPVKAFPENPYRRKILHIDCFKKILEDYSDFLKNDYLETRESVYDRIQRLGVTTLVLHEKWNSYQNYWEISEKDFWQTQQIVEECHKRGIEVIPYFGFEFSTLNPQWTDRKEEILKIAHNGHFGGGWYRKPYQRDYVVCYNSDWAEEFVVGFKKLYEEMKFDGIYLDTTLKPNSCCNHKHGCGYQKNGQVHYTYPVFSTRQFIREIYRFVNQKGGLVNSHLSNCMNASSLAYTHLNWDGEAVQMCIRDNGIEAIPHDYILTQYTGRNIGVPVELLVYEYPPEWTFEKSLPFSLVNGILPRPNDVGKPLECMSEIWRILDDFPVEDAEWISYRNRANELGCSHPDVRISYYKTAQRRLVFIANVGKSIVEDTIIAHTPVIEVYDCLKNSFVNLENSSFEIRLKELGLKIYIIK
ncbi:hypothetical protein [Acetivibrio sp. MSJd-27]|uniref:hypothetical protein n=1 Tax=Acetivibrio sp. MSJd-27 TaxID=2841523 RepID=UPI001C0F8785|nr:hypothetical protein [Acetivibrio sp. MSJd-27]MBU5450999.1 hypothetical protein [Acetivibrio sp. MSJd-27]